MKHKTLGVGLLIILAIVLILFGLKNKEQKNIQSNSNPKTIKIAYLPITQGLPLYLALDKGYFKAEGLNVEAVRFDSPQLILNALVAGQVDFGAPSTASGITGVVEYKNPGLLKIFALIGDDDKHINYELLVRNDSDIKNISDLKRKRIGILPGIQFRTLTRHILAQNGLDADKDVEMVEIAAGLHVQALASKQVDALSTLEPTGSIVIAKNIGRELTRAPALKYITNPFYGSAGVVRTEFAQNNPELARKVINVFGKAIAEINSDPNNSKTHLANYTSLDATLIEQVPLPAFKMYNEFGQGDIDALQKWYDVFTLYKIVDGKIDAKKLIYETP